MPIEELTLRYHLILSPLKFSIFRPYSFQFNRKSFLAPAMPYFKFQLFYMSMQWTVFFDYGIDIASRPAIWLIPCVTLCLRVLIRDFYGIKVAVGDLIGVDI